MSNRGALRMADRVLTIVITATLTSAIWIVAGSGLLSKVEEPQISQTEGIPTGTAELTSVNGPTADQGANRSAGANTAAKLIIPVSGVRAVQLVDSFSDGRGDGSRKHEAIDIMAARGTPVLAATSGTVEKLFLSDLGGKTIYIRSPDRGTIYYYAHLNRYASDLKENQHVRQGQTIGYVGSTGDASAHAPHLHFAILKTSPGSNWWDPTQAVDPYPILMSDSRDNSR